MATRWNRTEFATSRIQPVTTETRGKLAKTHPLTVTVPFPIQLRRLERDRLVGLLPIVSVEDLP